jgi:hypothetical protein
LFVKEVSASPDANPAACVKNFLRLYAIVCSLNRNFFHCRHYNEKARSPLA